MKRTFLCKIAELDDPGALRADLPGDEEKRGVCVVQKHGDVYVYENRCPHTGVPLDWNPGTFLDITNERIQCSLHAAQFRITDGFCIWGPCVGDSLNALPFEIENGAVWLVQPEA